MKLRDLNLLENEAADEAEEANKDKLQDWLSSYIVNAWLNGFAPEIVKDVGKLFDLKTNILYGDITKMSFVPKQGVKKFSWMANKTIHANNFMLRLAGTATKVNVVDNFNDFPNVHAIEFIGGAVIESFDGINKLEHLEELIFE